MKKGLGLIVLSAPLMMGQAGCDAPVSRSGVDIASPIQIAKGSDGLTTEQRNINERLKMDNAVGSIKHLYVISAYSGQVLIYSTVRGKVTSSGKRLTPSAVNSSSSFLVDFGYSQHYTQEVLQDDGTYGSSQEYLFWFDSKGVYHQQYVTGGMIVHISDQPLAVKSVTINMEATEVK